MSDHPLVGSWRLVSLFAKSATGTEMYPYGEDPVGMLMYAANGTMSAVLMRRGRPKFASGDVTNRTPQELQEAFDGFDAYCGMYSIDPNAEAVTHHIEASLFPNWEGADLLRYFQLDRNRLSISSEPLQALGQEWIIYAVWERRT